MVTIELRHDYAEPGDVLWSRISDFYDLSWLPAVAETRRVSDRPARVAVLPDGAGEVVEELVDQGRRHFRYKVTDAGPMPLRDFNAVIQVEDDTETACHITWQAQFEAVGASEADAHQAVTGVFDAGLRRLGELGVRA